MMRIFLTVSVFSLFGMTASAQYASDWNPDSDGDNTIGVNDLLALLSVFEETDSDNDGIFDSQDDCVGVYDACGVCNGTGMDVDVDGICDDVDPCVGELDVCGVCNGPGPNFPIIDEIVYVTDSLFVPPLGSWYVFSYAVDTLYTYVCPVQGCTDATAGNFNPESNLDDGSCLYGPVQCGYLSNVTFDDHTYNLVGIGTQCWFKENLRSDNYRNGDAIPGGFSNAEWTSTTTGAQAVYDNDTSNLAAYGRLYNWHAVNDARGLCPTGFHASTNSDWITLSGFIGGNAGALKANNGDMPGWDGTNSTGYSALPGGARYPYNYGFGQLGNYGIWWTNSSNQGGEALYIGMASGWTSLNFAYYPVSGGFSVRCLKD